MNYPIITKINKTKLENPIVKTLLFDYDKKVIPGQFFMVWIPGIDEIPMSVSYNDNKSGGITFKKVGDATEALFNLEKEDKIGIRGPYGNGFSILGKKPLFIGGGSGIATLAPVVTEYIKKKIKTTVILGVKSKNELFFDDKIKALGAQIYVSTEDGSMGYKGLATDLTKKLISENNYDSILTCGPEKMMKNIFDMTKNTHFQASLERYMKCGFGLCGQCCVGEGLRVCVEGPVFDGKTLKNIKDFGVFKRNAAGTKIKF
jgi:dihydroorotate dehydrogenase electron transfer subunit